MKYLIGTRFFLSSAGNGGRVLKGPAGVIARARGKKVSSEETRSCPKTRECVVIRAQMPPIQLAGIIRSFSHPPPRFSSSRRLRLQRWVVYGVCPVLGER